MRHADDPSRPAVEGESEPEPGRFAYDGLDRVIHERARLGVLTALVSAPKGQIFSDLKQLCALTDGNLSRHLQVLQEHGLIEIAKSFVHNRPQTMVRITAQGRERYVAYLAELERVVRDALPAASEPPRTAVAATGSAAPQPRPGNA